MGWNILIEDKQLKKRALGALEYIKHNTQVEGEEYHGLLTGNSGESLFWYYLFLLEGRLMDCNRAVNLIKGEALAMKEKPMEFTFGSGVSGIIWTITHLLKIGAIDNTVFDSNDMALDSFLFKFSAQEIKKGNYDYLYGGLSVLPYFLSNNGRENTYSILRELIGAALYQNIPNPFTQNTTVNCLIPSSANSYSLMIFNMNGGLVKTVPINGTGNQSIVINGSSLSAGMYYYTLIVDGKEVDTKKMILTQ